MRQSIKDGLTDKIKKTVKGDEAMDLSRAQEILNSPDTIPVLYQGSPVWIEKILNAESAEVTLLDRQERITVPVSKLVEQ